MFNTCTSADSKQPFNIIDDHFISVITTLFIEGMVLEQKTKPLSKSWRQFDQALRLREKTSIMPLPCSKQTEAITLKEYGTRKAEPNNVMRQARPDAAGETIRTFILGLSDAFNNLLMGIWGNLSLIALTCGKSKTAFQRVSEMEQMIHSGSALINAVFGYLGERRTIAKNIRLKQLIQEINQVLPVDSERITKDILHASLTTPVDHGRVTALASNLSQILRQFMERLQHRYSLIIHEKNLDKKALARTCKVKQLMDRASEILMLLDCYAGAEPLELKKTSARAIVAGLVRKFEARYPQLKISLDLAQRLPLIHADRSGMQFVLNQLMENAVSSMAGQGKLLIEAKTIKASPARNRCVAHRWSDSIVITVTDTGHGMDLNTLLHVFDPFYSHQDNSSRLGMGLAASWGLVKAHGGYIHVRSKEAHGSTFKVYLPIP
jgi:signal transduction histidine kinase